MMDFNQQPSLQDYTAFHGMLCRPRTARRVIQSFHGGALLFAHQNVYDAAVKGNEDLAHYDCRVAPIRLNIWTYYMLVVMSLTGGCSLLGYRKVISATEYIIKDNDKTISDERMLQFRKGDKSFIESSTTSSMLSLRLPPVAVDYVIDQSVKAEGNMSAASDKGGVAEITLVRKFEYDFGGYLSVMMLHFLCNKGRTHLVEIYRINTGTAPGILANVMVKFLNRLNKFLIQRRGRK